MFATHRMFMQLAPQRGVVLRLDSRNTGSAPLADFGVGQGVIEGAKAETVRQAAGAFGQTVASVDVEQLDGLE